MEEFAESDTNPSAHELVILHTSEAQEWATYLQHTLKSSKKFRKFSILPFAVDSTDQLHGYSFEHFQSCKCIVLLLSGAFLDFLYQSELQGALQGLLYPPHRVVVLLCGVTENDISTVGFQDWQSWRKVFAEDEPAVYVSTILDSIADGKQVEAKHKENINAPQQHTAEPAASERVHTDVTDSVVSVVQHQTAVSQEEPEDQDTETLYIILTEKLDDQSTPELEFSSESGETTRVPAAVENQYTLSVAAPDMPEGEVSLTMHTDHVCVHLGSVTYYTRMSEVSRCLGCASDPVDFLCQAFNFTNNATELVDDMLTDSLNSRMPPNSFQVFGNRQIEKDNMAAYQRDLELPTLLHFAARYGLKKMMTTLLQCPGAMQAYSVMNKHGDYPNTLAEKSGFPNLRDFMDKFVETADMMQQSMNTETDVEVYEPMSAPSQDVMITEDIYESMLELNPEYADDLYEVMNAVDENPEEALLRTFFQSKLEHNDIEDQCEPPRNEEEEKGEQQEKEQDDPYNFFPEDIYDSVDQSITYNQVVQNRPPAPIPRPQSECERSETYISRVFSPQRDSMEIKNIAVRPFSLAPTSTYDPYSGMKTPGQRQLISLQERVKVGEITVNEAVQEFKAWSLDHERRAQSIRYQQENLKRLRDSITRRHKERDKTGKEFDLEISAPIQRNSFWGMNTTTECAVYDPSPRQVAPPPPATNTIQRGSWKTGSTSSTSSTESNRLSTHSTISYSSGTEPDIEDTQENPAPPQLQRRRRTEVPPAMPPPRIPPRVPERAPDILVNERYVSYPTRALPHVPSNRQSQTAPPLPRRPR
ncbi:phosphoinositide 3-kinase adapter protein 1 isoform X2 [Cynoglossus semilaevis]|uniref:phosphoinositide 3-kinase adapter protein 1 isoform X2 n=1 Tax=Cynoglossus semilaevis TaxID=244447 RepID=UPI000D62BAC0|nr:phosphoinositide 3-kinase adapter protein 1 isoform X2 [Cynoglossus semilaevis]